MELFYQKTGKGHPLIILHGLLGMSDNWMNIANTLKDDYTVFAVDLRNHGRSKHHRVFNYDAMADDLLEFMEAQAMLSANLMGHSMGGKTAMQFAFNYPEKVDKLVVVDISPGSYNHSHDKLIGALLSADIEKFHSRNEVRQALNERISDLRITNFLLKNMYWKDKATLGWKANLEVIEENLPEIYRAIGSMGPFEKPTLFLRGGESKYITDNHFPIIRQLFPTSEIKTIPGASHWLHTEKPEEFVTLVRGFLGQHEWDVASPDCH